MLGYFNREVARRRRWSAGRVVFYSRSKQRLWEKGETSGNTFHLVSIAPGLRQRLAARARACHGTCLSSRHAHLLRRRRTAGQHRHRLPGPARGSDRIAHRERGPKAATPPRLYAEGTRRMAQKVGEEGVEVALAATSGDEQELLNESADLVFHLALLLRDRGLSLARVAARTGCPSPHHRVRRRRNAAVAGREPLEDQFLGRRTQVVARSHRAAVRADIGDQQHIAFAWSPASGGRDPARRRFRRSVPRCRKCRIGLAGRPAQVHDLMERAVQRRPDQRVHARGNADVALFALLLELRDAGEQHTGERDEVAPGFDPQRESGSCRHGTRAAPGRAP